MRRRSMNDDVVEEVGGTASIDEMLHTGHGEIGDQTGGEKFGCEASAVANEGSSSRDERRHNRAELHDGPQQHIQPPGGELTRLKSEVSRLDNVCRAAITEHTIRTDAPTHILVVSLRRRTKVWLIGSRLNCMELTPRSPGVPQRARLRRTVRYRASPRRARPQRGPRRRRGARPSAPVVGAGPAALRRGRRCGVDAARATASARVTLCHGAQRETHEQVRSRQRVGRWQQRSPHRPNARRQTGRPDGDRR